MEVKELEKLRAFFSSDAEDRTQEMVEKAPLLLSFLDSLISMLRGREDRYHSDFCSLAEGVVRLDELLKIHRVYAEHEQAHLGQNYTIGNLVEEFVLVAESLLRVRNVLIETDLDSTLSNRTVHIDKTKFVRLFLEVMNGFCSKLLENPVKEKKRINLSAKSVSVSQKSKVALTISFCRESDGTSFRLPASSIAYEMARDIGLTLEVKEDDWMDNVVLILPSEVLVDDK